ncbi:MAG: hypothetical protein ABSE67_08675 [Xanthobacteraceae bacterium]|jgi:uncharacterized protein YjgD (DUF1641 family)
MSDLSLSNAPIDELGQLQQAAREALTDSMVERLAISGANALQLLDRLNDERTSDAINVLIDRVTELHNVGALNTLFDMVVLLHAARDASTDSIIERLFGFFEQIINTVGNEAMAALASNARQALDEAAAETAQTVPRGGLLATISMLSKPEAQRSLAFLLSFGAKLQRGATGA